MVPPVARHSTIAPGSVSPAAVTRSAPNRCVPPGATETAPGTTATATTRSGGGGAATDVSRHVKQAAAATNAPVRRSDVDMITRDAVILSLRLIREAGIETTALATAA